MNQGSSPLITRSRLSKETRPPQPQKNSRTSCKWLKKAIENGFKDWDHLKKDKDFTNIKSSACFREILRNSH